MAIRKDILEKFPQWYKNLFDENLLTERDADSLVAQAIMREQFPFMTLNEIFTFDARYKSNLQADSDKVIALDVARREGKGIDNHMQRETFYGQINKDSINLNNVYEHVSFINRKSYILKYAMSTAIFLYALFDIPLPTSKRGKQYLLMIDSGYKGFFNDEYKETFLINLKVLGLDELIAILEEHDADWWKREAYQLSRKLNIHINKDGFLQIATKNEKGKIVGLTDSEYIQEVEDALGIKFDLPKTQFHLVERYQYLTYKSGFPEEIINDKDVYSFAYTLSNELRISRKMQLENGEWIPIPYNDNIAFLARLKRFSKSKERNEYQLYLDELKELDRELFINTLFDYIESNINYYRKKYNL